MKETNYLLKTHQTKYFLFLMLSHPKNEGLKRENMNQMN